MPRKITSVAKLFRNGRSQAVRLPQEFRFKGKAVRVRKVPEGVLLQPLISDVREWFAALDQTRKEPFMQDGRDQPPAPRRRIFR
jgi:antitoxin VapB